MRNFTCIFTLLLLVQSISVFAEDCKTMRPEYLKDRHRCISLFRKTFSPEKQLQMGFPTYHTDKKVDDCFESLFSKWNAFMDGGKCKGVVEKEIDEKFEEYTKACLHQKNFSKCEMLLKDKKVDNIRSGGGATLLMYAAQEGDIDAMEFLLNNGASTKAVNHYGSNLLHFALYSKKEKFSGNKDPDAVIYSIVKKILELGIHPQELNILEESSLDCAVKFNLPTSVVDLLIKKGAYLDGRVIYDATMNDRLEVIEKALNDNFDVNTILDVTNNGMPVTILEEAIILKKNQILDVLLKKRVNVNQRSPDKSGSGYMTPLCFAQISKNLEGTKKLIKAGANVNEQCLWPKKDSTNYLQAKLVVGKKLDSFFKEINDGKSSEYYMSPLCLALDYYNTEAAIDLIKSGANVNEKCEKGTPLSMAILNDDYAVAEELIRAKVNVNAILDNGKTMLELAEEYPCGELKCSDESDDEEECECDPDATYRIAKLLKKAGASKPFRSDFITYCMQPDLTEKMVLDAIKQGADVNETDSEGFTPLHAVAQEGKNPKVMLALIKKGAIVNATTRSGISPLLIAASNNPDPSFIKILINAGADINAEDSDKWGALAISVAHNTPEVVAFLLKTKLGSSLSDADKNWLVRVAISNNSNSKVLTTLFKNGISAKPVGSGWNLKNPLYTALEKKKDFEIVKLLLINGGIVDDKCMRQARDLPMNTPEERKYRNQMIDLLTKYK